MPALTHLEPIPRDFYARGTLDVARDLLGCLLVRELDDGTRLAGRIIETEAYDGPTDTACHGARGCTARTRSLFGPPGHAYVYLVYGIHDLFNVVTDRADYPAGVLIRALEPIAGIETMKRLRPVPERRLTDGPGKLSRALAIDRSQDGHDLTLGSGLWLARCKLPPKRPVVTGPRIGIDYADPVDRLAPWRFRLLPAVQENSAQSPS
ncbi:MAG: DNA-3-methyladenine glycosylase [Halothiobacillaceae bacterium]